MINIYKNYRKLKLIYKFIRIEKITILLFDIEKYILYNSSIFIKNGATVIFSGKRDDMNYGIL